MVSGILRGCSSGEEKCNILFKLSVLYQFLKKNKWVHTNKNAKVCPDLTKVFDNKFSQKGENIMNTDQIKPEPMKKDQLEKVKKQIVQTYLFLISRTGYDPKVIEVMKLAALADAQRRFEAEESW